jgi:aminoglycoside phosphotransferase
MKKQATKKTVAKKETKKASYNRGDHFSITEILDLSEEAKEEFLEIARENGVYLEDPNLHIVQPVYLTKVKHPQLKELHKEFEGFGWDYIGVEEE